MAQVPLVGGVRVLGVGSFEEDGKGSPAMALAACLRSSSPFFRSRLSASIRAMIRCFSSLASVFLFACCCSQSIRALLRADSPPSARSLPLPLSVCAAAACARSSSSRLSLARAMRSAFSLASRLRRSASRRAPRSDRRACTCSGECEEVGSAGAKGAPSLVASSTGAAAGAGAVVACCCACDGASTLAPSASTPHALSKRCSHSEYSRLPSSLSTTVPLWMMTRVGAASIGQKAPRKLASCVP